MDGELTESDEAVGKYKYDVTIGKFDFTDAIILYNLGFEIEVASNADQDDPPIIITAPWPEFYRNNKESLPYQMTEPT